MNFYTSVQQYGNKMLVRSFEDGRRQQYEVPYQPYLFVKDRSGKADYKSVFGDPVAKMGFGSIREAKDFMKKYDGVQGFEFFGMTQFVYPFINDKFPGEVKYDRKHINVVSLDIETMADGGFPDIRTANKALTAITISDGKEFVFLSIKEYVPHIDNVRVIRCQDEKELIAHFVHEWRKMDPDIITGWNVEFFDIPYLINRIKLISGDEMAKRLSPWNIIRESVQKQHGNEVQTYDISGVAVMDYMAVYKKWTFTTQESYRLDHIANVELGVGKLDYGEYGSLHGLYEQNFQLYAEYNIRDTEIINQLDDKLKLMNLVLALAYDAKLNYSDAYTSVRMWDVIIHNYLMDKKIVIPQYKNDHSEFEFAGGYVKVPYNGRHDWVCSFDLNSLYPHLIMQYNISPETYVGQHPMIGKDVDAALNGVYNGIRDDLESENLTITPNGCLWSREEQGFLPALMEKMYLDRKMYKGKMLGMQQKYQDTGDKAFADEALRLDMTQLAKKIQLNCAYGALGNQWFRWFNPKYAESVTLGGQMSIRWIEREVNKFLNKKLKTEDFDYVIASDTDSIYLRLGNAVTAAYGDNVPDDDAVVKYLDKVCGQLIEPFIDKSYSQLAEYVNAFQQKMIMKREAIASKGIWTGKKHYILNVHNNEGVQYAEPKLKIMGIEAVRSSTPAPCRVKIKEALEIIMNKEEDDLIKFVDNFRKEFKTLPYEKVAFPRSLNGMNKYRDAAMGWKKGTPIAVRGAFVYNRMIKDLGLTNEIERLRDGDKIKFAYLTVPNPSRENVISCLDEMPDKFHMNRYIDYDKQFEKSFESPLRGITDVIGWQLEKISTLEDFFA